MADIATGSNSGDLHASFLRQSHHPIYVEKMQKLERKHLPERLAGFVDLQVWFYEILCPWV